MTRILRLALLGVALTGAATLPALARENSGQGSIILSAPGPAQMLDAARAALSQGNGAAALAQVEAAQHRLLRDSTARNLPAEASREAMRAAVPVLDRARQALARQDLATAAAAVAEARGML
jgi:hypothetical protein